MDMEAPKGNRRPAPIRVHEEPETPKLWLWGIREFFQPVWRRGLVYVALIVFVAKVDLGGAGVAAILGIVVTLLILAVEFYYWAIYKLE